MKVLIAEDDRVSREILVRALEKAHYSIQIVANGSAALAALLEADAPLIALLDWVMPGLDGPEVCRRLRAASPKIQPHIIIVSSKSHKGEIAAGLDAGADDFLTKPIDHEELLARVRVAERTVGYQLALQQQFEQLESLGRRYSLLGEIVAQQLQPPAEMLDTEIDPLTAAENAPPPTWFTPGEIEKLVPRALTELGLSVNLAVATSGERATGVASFTTWAGFVDLDHNRWIDLVIEIDAQAAAVVYERALRRKPQSPQEICSFLAETQTVIGTALKNALQTKGGTLIAPLLSRAQQRDLWEPALRIPAESETYRFVLDGIPLELAVVCYPCIPRSRSPWDLRHHEILSAAYPAGTGGTSRVGERGAALTDHLIKQIADHADRMPQEENVSVYELSPIAQRFHRNHAQPRAL